MVREWTAITLSDIANIGSGRDIYEAERVDGDTPYITSGTSDNGIGFFVGNTNDTLTSDVIVLNRNGAVGNAFYHPYKALVSNDCRTVELNEDVTADCKLFVARAITEQRGCFSYSRKLGTARAKKMRVMLPVDAEGNPDWDYMSSYVEEMRQSLLERYKTYVNERIFELEYRDILSLDRVEWSVFHIGELFDVKRPTARSKDDYEDGNVPFVASGAANNGVMKCCAPKGCEKLDAGGCITVSPVDGSSFYQPMDFLGRGGAGSSILMLYNMNVSEWSGQFIARMVQQTCSKYTYGHMGNIDSIKREVIQLPATSDGKPDYAYMEQYVKNTMLKKYQQYLDYIDTQQNN